MTPLQQILEVYRAKSQSERRACLTSKVSKTAIHNVVAGLKDADRGKLINILRHDHSAVSGGVLNNKGNILKIGSQK